MKNMEPTQTDESDDLKRLRERVAEATAPPRKGFGANTWATADTFHIQFGDVNVTIFQVFDAGAMHRDRPTVTIETEETDAPLIVRVNDSIVVNRS